MRYKSHLNMPQREKTVAEYQTEIAQLQKAAELPGVDAAERKIYLDTIRRIESKIAAVRARSNTTPPPAPPANPAAHANDPIPIRVIKPVPQNLRAIPVATEPDNIPVISATITATTPSVTIIWGPDHSDTMTEGEARSRFTTALRDLVESRLVKIGRIEAIQSYITFHRAVAYYRALIEFWGEPPTAQQLAIAPLKGMRGFVFEKITQAAAEAIQQIEK